MRFFTRCGIAAGRTVRVWALCASIHCRVSALLSSSNQRYGSTTSDPWISSRKLSLRLWGQFAEKRNPMAGRKQQDALHRTK
jgi:hypothetical protein